MNGPNRYRNKHYEKHDKNDTRDKKDFNERYICNNDDFLTNRLHLHERETSELECNNIHVNCILKQSTKDETECWIELSSLVRYKKSVGFPLLRGHKTFSYGKLLYFEQFKYKIDKLNPSSTLSDNILFQVAIILYSMYKREIFVDNFEFDIINIPKSVFYINVNQLIFELCTDKLIILSLCTRPYRAKLPQSCYLNVLHCFDSVSKKSYEMSNYFFEWLIKNHLSLLSKDGVDMFKIRKKTITGNYINRFIEPGTIVLVYRDDVYVAGITLTHVSISDNVRVLFSSDGGHILEIDDFYIQDVFLYNEFFIRSQLTAIVI
ncbi:hypothetical protein [Swinepox virus]|uniref:Uncharacterized protein n=1 Tax=Swinepox virus TaxID=10276 RepID=A0A881SY40_SWPV|nr:hypothetical protein [Swinepox virus]